MESLGAGRIVHYVMPDGEVRPAMVVRIWSLDNGCVNLNVFVDFLNDKSETSPIWKTSVLYDENKEPNTWHWPERELKVVKL